MVAFLVGIVVSVVVAYIIGLPALRLIGFLLAIATLGFGVIVTIIWEELIEITGGVSGLPGIPPLSLFGITIEGDYQYYYLAWTIAFLLRTVSTTAW